LQHLLLTQLLMMLPDQLWIISTRNRILLGKYPLNRPVQKIVSDTGRFRIFGNHITVQSFTNLHCSDMNSKQ